MNPQWGTLLRNVIGDGSAMLRGGPFAPAGTSIPYGTGSLQMTVGDSKSKVAFGNEVDFFGDPLADVTAVGFQVLTTGESQNGNNRRTDESAGVPSKNVPSIVFEISPSGALNDFSSLVWVPAANTPANLWSDYLDATTTGTWFFTNAGIGTCLIGAPCSFADALAAVPNAAIYTFSVSKGRDNPWQGAIDGLRLNGTIYDFEPLGVIERAID